MAVSKSALFLRQAQQADFEILRHTKQLIDRVSLVIGKFAPRLLKHEANFAIGTRVGESLGAATHGESFRIYAPSPDMTATIR